LTNARACKGVGQEWSLGVTFHVPRNVGKCEGMNPTFPNVFSFWKLESRWIPKFSEGDYKHENSLDCRVPYTNGNILERGCLKWAHMSHLGT
jgi:hypothetical protein